MATALTFTETSLLASPIAGADGIVHYTTSTTHTAQGRGHTAITSASGGLHAQIDWAGKTFAVDGVCRRWDEVKAGTGWIFSSERQWTWGARAYSVKYRNAAKELLATPILGGPAGAVRFTPPRAHGTIRAAIYFPHQITDARERLFLLMAVLQTEIERQDQFTLAVPVVKAAEPKYQPYHRLLLEAETGAAYASLRA
ncbi:hypothetical protein FB451DRAFT_1277008 [Mycena latifolia]|nr:hypothetical protein FB451DRAFT_1277008 [Mycena latifolia]